jgi:hypothetical protein
MCLTVVVSTYFPRRSADQSDLSCPDYAQQQLPVDMNLDRIHSAHVSAPLADYLFIC